MIKIGLMAPAGMKIYNGVLLEFISLVQESSFGNSPILVKKPQK